MNTISNLILKNQAQELHSFLLKNKDKVNISDQSPSTYTWTPLYWSVKHRKIDCIKILLKLGADINIVVNDTEECCGTVLDLATLRDDDEIQLILKEHAESKDLEFSQSFRAIRTRLRGRTPSFDFRNNKG